MTIELRGGEVDAGAFWKTIGERPVGATLVTALTAAGPAGFLGLSAAHVTASPPTMLVSVDRRTSALAPMLEARHFAVSFLPEGQADLAATFGGKGKKVFAQGEWDALVTGAPIFRKALGALDCTIVRTVEHEGVVVIFGAVEAVRARGEGAPLTFFRGRFESGLHQ